MKSRLIDIADAVGTVLSHDLTLIDAERGYKGARFKKGHTVMEEDVELLKRMGREHLSILELGGDEVHEDDAALRVAEALRKAAETSSKFTPSFTLNFTSRDPSFPFSIQGPSEGKCSLVAEAEGLLLFDEEMVHKINSDENWVFSTLANKIPVSKGETVAAWRVAPLVVKESTVRHAERLARPFALRSFRPLPTALVTTGREIWEGKVRDAFLGKLKKKLALYGAPLVAQETTFDDKEVIRRCIETALSRGAEVIFCTGGMSVDADDMTPAAIQDVASEVVFRWTPVLPGSNFMLAKKGAVFLLGVPACAVHTDTTVLDTVMHRIYAGLPLTNEEVRRWGVGGLCRGCGNCNYPTCFFGSRP